MFILYGYEYSSEGLEKVMHFASSLSVVLLKKIIFEMAKLNNQVAEPIDVGECDCLCYKYTVEDKDYYLCIEEVDLV